MIDQKSVCEMLGKKLGTDPKWEGKVCIIENEDAVLRVDENAGVELKVKNPEKGQEIIKIIRETYMDTR